MTTTPRPIRDLNVPLTQLQSDLRHLLARQRTDAAAERLGRLLAEQPTAVPPSPGELAEQRHLLLDADPDSTTRQFVDLAKGKPWRAL
ncbi:hypothetical protein [Streptomyces mirabilis]|uniref:hypothetical protein n=1 Tax=Streptomyces mirabilis TaxID=68239 RepID=UPI0033DA89EB